MKPGADFWLRVLIAERISSCVIKGEEERVLRISPEIETDIFSRYSEGSGRVDVGFHKLLKKNSKKEKSFQVSVICGDKRGGIWIRRKKGFRLGYIFSAEANGERLSI